MHADSIAVGYWNKLLATDPLVVSGGVSARLSYSSANKKVPFAYLLSGNVETRIWGLNVPLSFTFSNANFNYQLSSPIRFNRLKFNPQYKWVKLYLGQSNMSFSQYTLSTIQFTGIGVELSPPGAFKFSLMKGRIFDAVEYDSLSPRRIPVYQRNGNALKVTYNKNNFSVEASIFEGHDLAKSISIPSDVSIAIAPYQNIAYNVKTIFSPLKEVSLDIEYASSAINFNYYNTTRSFTEMLWGKHDGVNRYSAYKVAINFSPKKFKSGLSIERIDPDFKTLGAYYSKSDFQNITCNFSTNLWQGKVAIVANGGVEFDNLNNLDQDVNTRTVASANIMFRPSKIIDINLAYSDFKSISNISNQFDYINQTDPSLVIDTLNFQQVTRNASVSANYAIAKTKDMSQNASIVLNLTESGSTGANAIGTKMTYYAANARWNYFLLPQKLGLNAGFNATFTQTGDDLTTMLGPTVSAKKQLLNKKFDAALSISYNTSLLNGGQTARNFNTKLTGSYSFRKIHVVSINIGFLNRKQTEKKSSSSATVALTYSLKMKDIKLFSPIKPALVTQKQTNDEQQSEN